MNPRRVTNPRQVVKPGRAGGTEWLVIETTPELISEHRFPADKPEAAEEKANELVAAGYERVGPKVVA